MRFLLRIHSSRLSRMPLPRQIQTQLDRVSKELLRSASRRTDGARLKRGDFTGRLPIAVDIGNGHPSFNSSSSLVAVFLDMTHFLYLPSPIRFFLLSFFLSLFLSFMERFTQAPPYITSLIDSAVAARACKDASILYRHNPGADPLRFSLIVSTMTCADISFIPSTENMYRFRETNVMQSPALPREAWLIFLMLQCSVKSLKCPAILAAAANLAFFYAFLPK